MELPRLRNSLWRFNDGGKRHFAALGAADLDGTRGLQPHRVRRFYCCSTGGSSREEDLAL
jgi:hypothetical protein